MFILFIHDCCCLFVRLVAVLASILQECDMPVEESLQGTDDALKPEAGWIHSLKDSFGMCLQFTFQIHAGNQVRPFIP